MTDTGTIDADLLDSLFTTEEVQHVEKEEVGGEEKKVVVDEEVKEPELDDLYDEKESEEEVKTTTKKEESSNIDALKKVASFMLDKSGLEADVDQITNEEEFEEFLIALNEQKGIDHYTQLKQSNPVANAMLEILEAGGNAEDLVGLFQEQKKVSTIDISSNEGKLEKIKKYYKEIEKKSDTWIKAQINRIQSSDEDLKIEFDEIDERYNQYFEEEVNAKIDQQKNKDAQKQQYLKNQTEKLSTFLNTEKYKPKEVEEYINFVFDDSRYKLKDTQKGISAFDVAILEAKKDPQALADLALFLKDKEKYNTKILTQKNNTKADSIFKSITEKQVSASGSEVQTEKPKTKGFQFNF